MKQGKQSVCVTISRREKDDDQPIISYVVYLIQVDMSFSQNIDVFLSVSVKLKCQILFQVISDATKIVLYQAVTIGNPEKKSSLMWRYISFYNED